MQNRWAVVLPGPGHDEPGSLKAIDGTCNHCGVFVDRRKDTTGQTQWSRHVERLLTDDEVIVATLAGTLIDYMEAQDRRLWEERKSWLGTD